ncbi:MAG TPA: hypothetical protein VK631_15220 [Solirubrobacteraceae bacterium]|nr:hypothetical protein [Solirubrobacteraceae bacterium]
MAGDRDAGVDPRFDPVFQRGYDPAVHSGRQPRTTPRHGTEPTPVIASPEAPEPRAAAVPAVEQVASAPGPDTTSPVTDAEFETHSRNPFRLALLLVSIGFAAGAALLLWRRLQDDPYGNSYARGTSGDVFAYQFVEALLAPLLTAALIGMCLWLVLWAIRPGRRRE